MPGEFTPHVAVPGHAPRGCGGCALCCLPEQPEERPTREWSRDHKALLKRSLGIAKLYVFGNSREWP